MRAITLLGPQFRAPNLGPVLKELGLRGPLISITAGWQEREGEVDELAAHVGFDVVDLQLYARTEEIFARDRQLYERYRARQERLRGMQGLYRLQLERAADAVAAVWNRAADAAIARPARRSALGIVRRLDREHALAIERVHRQFARATGLADRNEIARHRQQIIALLRPAAAVLIAGGHVAVLLNRMRLLGLAELIRDRPVLAWSAGAMAIAERVVLFHDQPPQGPGIAELFDLGLGLVPAVLPLPHAQTRLHLHDDVHVSIFARRFAPAHCLTLDHGAALSFGDGRLLSSAGSWQLSRDGTLAEAVPT